MCWLLSSYKTIYVWINCIIFLLSLVTSYYSDSYTLINRS